LKEQYRTKEFYLSAIYKLNDYWLWEWMLRDVEIRLEQIDWRNFQLFSTEKIETLEEAQSIVEYYVKSCFILK
jgi:hypothetical protein